jgi:Zn-dependent protease
MFITPLEIGKIIIITIAAGLIFRSSLGLHRHFSFWRSVLMVGVLTAPAIILHELAHKAVAMGYGLDATLEIPYLWLGIGVVLALFNAPLVFFVPAYVGFSGDVTPLQHLLIAAAGPLTNLLLWLIAWIVLRTAQPDQFWRVVWAVTRRMNGFLFVINILPIPGFDGYHVFSSLLLILGVKPLL